jgi:hypothetical protein
MRHEKSTGMLIIEDVYIWKMLRVLLVGSPAVLPVLCKT